MIDPTKTYTTRDGRPVRILCTDRKHSFCPVMALVRTTDMECGAPDHAREDAFYYTAEGEYGNCPIGTTSPLDLIAAPPAPVRHQLKRWVNFFRVDGKIVPGILFNYREEADRYAGTDRIACLPITLAFAEGEGLEFTEGEGL